MIKISKKEREYLISKGVPLKDDGISKTLKNKYFLCESDTNIKLLAEYRKLMTLYSSNNKN